MPKSNDIGVSLGVDEVSAVTLDEAWEEAQAALPEGFTLWRLMDAGLLGWVADARKPAIPEGLSAQGRGPTPAAALHALAVALQSQEAGE
jgi:hypothetical protein